MKPKQFFVSLKLAGKIFIFLAYNSMRIFSNRLSEFGKHNKMTKKFKRYCRQLNSTNCRNNLCKLVSAKKGLLCGHCVDEGLQNDIEIDEQTLRHVLKIIINIKMFRDKISLPITGSCSVIANPN